MKSRPAPRPSEETRQLLDLIMRRYDLRPSDALKLLNEMGKIVMTPGWESPEPNPLGWAAGLGFEGLNGLLEDDKPSAQTVDPKTTRTRSGTESK